MIDRKWLDQLEFLDGLREAVHLRSYGSKNPLTEYKIDGFNKFDEIIEEIRSEIAARVFKVRIQIAPQPQPQRVMQGNAQHDEAQSMSDEARASQMTRNAKAQAARTMAGASTGQSVTVTRTMPKIGRNDPCPCGSGKKYKNCHGR
jgi:preprotein translocase subunit SecA